MDPDFDGYHVIHYEVHHHHLVIKYLMVFLHLNYFVLVHRWDSVHLGFVYLLGQQVLHTKLYAMYVEYMCEINMEFITYSACRRYISELN